MADNTARRLVDRHPLQRLNSPSRGASALLHARFLSVKGLRAYADFTTVPWSGFLRILFLLARAKPKSRSYGWHLQYLTIIGLSLAAATFAVGLLADLSASPTLFRVKNALSVASAPMECLISLLYWSLRAVDEKLVLPDWAMRLPMHTDLSFHAVPSLTLVIDLLFFSPPYSITFLPALALSGCIAFGYWFWIERCYQFNNFYPYPLFEMLSTAERIGLFGASALLMTLSTSLLVWLYGVVNGKVTGQQKSGNVKGE
ncbi:uncharacterized protein LTR77_002010 [Saxophila tyrrhenica]|uniref:Integral membrane protein n=1 Tax=Saxophila tyrrhenica TaxID=1690608 RepID=A0AAV9PHV8_9PEZI|nr:hypothetical protein LTR77_002010 [Saxophila tyrrhenica]